MSNGHNPRRETLQPFPSHPVSSAYLRLGWPPRPHTVARELKSPRLVRELVLGRGVPGLGRMLRRDTEEGVAPATILLLRWGSSPPRTTRSFRGKDRTPQGGRPQGDSTPQDGSSQHAKTRRESIVQRSNPHPPKPLPPKNNSPDLSRPFVLFACVGHVKYYCF